MAKRSSYEVIDYGEWTRPRMRDFREQCCDCGLIHRLDFRIVDATKGRARPSSLQKGRAPPSSRSTKGSSRPSRRLHVEFRTRRDDRATAAARRPFRFTPDE
jgi:hypothetical protein